MRDSVKRWFLAAAVLAWAAASLLALTPRQRGLALIQQGDRCFYRTDYPGALALYRKAERLLPGDPRPVQRVGIALLRSGDRPGARQALAEAVRRDPGFLDALMPLVTLLPPAEARPMLYRVLRDRPGNQEALTLLASLAQDEGDLARARFWLRKVLEVNPEQNLAHYGLAQLDRAEGRWREAVDGYARAMGHHPRLDAEALYQRGLALLQLGDPAGAEQSFRQCVASRPDWPEGHLALGLLLTSREPAEARRELATFLRLAPTHPGASRVREALRQLPP
ncbi:MAG: tetratricopeptide repeat protein [Candidatus Eremiobacterota bacterium]